MTGGTYLDRIVDDVRARLGSGLAAPVAAPATVSLERSIRASRAADELAVIAEVKRRSPSAGDIAADTDAATQARRYEAAGAAGISVLTEPDHFGGSLDDLAAARAAVEVPLLRKDFVVDPSQLDDAVSAGAAAVLLIAAILSDTQLRQLSAHAAAAGLDVLLEVHDEQDLARALLTDVTLIGINNRDLRSFDVDLAVTERLAPLVPADRLVVAESGVRTTADAARMRRAGADAVLVGEALMRAADPAAELRAFTQAGSAPLAGGAR